MLLAEPARGHATRQIDRAQQNARNAPDRRSRRRPADDDLPREDKLAAQRLRARGLAVLHASELFQPDAAHHLPQRRRPARAGDRHSLSVAVPRRPDRRAHPEPAGAGRDHRHRDRRLGDRSIPTAPPSIRSGCSNCSPARPTIRPTTGAPGSISRSIRCASRRCCSGSSRRPTRARASMIATARFILDSLALYDVLRFDLPPPESAQPNYFERRLDGAAALARRAATCRPIASSARQTARATRKSRSR